MEHTEYTAPWHKETYDRFINVRLPELIAARLPLESYSVATTDPHTLTIHVTVANASGRTCLEIAGVPQPDASGVFEIDGQRKVVIPFASGRSSFTTILPSRIVAPRAT